MFIAQSIYSRKLHQTPKFRGLVPTVWRREGVERGAVGVSEDGGEDGAEEEGAGAPEGRVDAARVARVEVEQLDAAGGLERAVHVPQVLRVHQGQGGAVCRGGVDSVVDGSPPRGQW